MGIFKLALDLVQIDCFEMIPFVYITLIIFNKMLVSVIKP